MCVEWKALPLYYTLQNLVALLSGRIFVGHPLSRNEAWVLCDSGSLDWEILTVEFSFMLP